MKPTAGMPWNMLLLGTLGMLSGLALDAHALGLALITSQCGADATHGFLQVLYLHWSGLPAMHIGMVCAGLSAAPLRRLTKPCAHSSLRVEFMDHTVCLIWMLLGMTFGSMVCESSAIELSGGPVSDRSAVVMLCGMFAGMISGMLAHTALNHAIKKLRRTSILAA